MWSALSDKRTDLSFTMLLVLANAVILRSEFRGTRDHILLSQIRDFLFVASYDSQVEVLDPLPPHFPHGQF
jgi:hypothetical protein